ncbi:diadenylate cyclase CdaA [Blattabacterium cuenoti]|uniref:diadenylate cyclase CdaA n=1 Tax=Blattabacterium cuenoti TaxID=1653831 RepID=UPI001EEC6446|nr:diadenylate cyclase CdaA [Blattabacterium cuenoti]
MFQKIIYILKIYFREIIDVTLVCIILFKIYKLVYNTITINIFYGFIITFIFYKIIEIYKIKFISMIINAFFKVGFLALIILFQPEIRKFLLIVGSKLYLQKIIPLFFKKSIISNTKTKTIDSIAKACAIFSMNKTGVLIVIQLHQDIKNFIKNGDRMNAKVNSPILESIFYKNSPLHDGATIILKNIIIRTRAILPVSYNKFIPYQLGLRHRAAIGITEKTDAICLVVSEETGNISYVKNSKIITITNINNLKIKLEEDLIYNS